MEIKSTYTYKKYKSFILSCLLHALMLFLVVYSRVKQTTEPLYARKFEAAPVQFETLGQAPPALQSMQPLAPPMPARTTEPEIEAQDTSDTKTITEPPKKTESESIKEIPEMLEIPNPLNEPNDQENIYSATPKKVTPQAFMQAFRAAIRAERRETQGVSPQSDKNLGPRHVQERMKEWGQHHYRQRIITALRKASRLRSRKMHNNRSINKTVLLRIPITKQGTLGDMTKYPLSGIPEIDQYVLEILRSADFPPIPQRYNTDKFLFEVPMRISLKQGTGMYNLSVS